MVSGGQRFVPSPLLLQLSQSAAQASVCVLHSQWRKHHDNPHELSKREGRTSLGSVKDHNSLRVKRKRRRPAKTEFPSPVHRGDSHEEGTFVNGNVFLQGQSAAVPVALMPVGPNHCSPEAEQLLELLASFNMLGSKIELQHDAGLPFAGQQMCMHGSVACFLKAQFSPQVTLRRSPRTTFGISFQWC